MEAHEVESLVAALESWARACDDMRGLAIIGSWARGTARPDSDLDIMLLVEAPEHFRSGTSWLLEIPWSDTGFAWIRFEDIDYGAAWSRHLALEPDGELELCFASPSWASAEPLDEGTASVVTGGCRIVLDRDGLFESLLEQLAARQPGGGS